MNCCMPLIQEPISVQSESREVIKVDYSTLQENFINLDFLSQRVLWQVNRTSLSMVVGNTLV